MPKLSSVRFTPMSLVVALCMISYFSAADNLIYFRYLWINPACPNFFLRYRNAVPSRLPSLSNEHSLSSVWRPYLTQVDSLSSLKFFLQKFSRNLPFEAPHFANLSSDL